MPFLSGLELLERLQKEYPEIITSRYQRL
ncbi:MAG: hypothetical protein ACLUPF_06590 [Dorea sp.]